MSKKKINKGGGRPSAKRDKPDTKKDHETLIVGEEMQGTIDVARSGDAFVTVEGKTRDFFIHRKNINHAFDGDTVKIMRKHTPKSSRPEAIVMEVVQRKRTHFIGVVERVNNTCFVIPDNTGIKADFYVPEARSQHAKHRDKVVVELAEWRPKDRNPIGHITEILGQAGSNDIEMKSILVENGFFTSFPKDVLN